jgi:ribosome-associated protein
MNLIDLQNTVIDALEDIKGQHIQVFDAQPLTSMFDRVVIVSGTSNRQTRALAKHLHDKVKQAGGSVLSTEGEDTGEWVLVDLGDVIVHIMQPAIREYYALEELWGKYLIDWQAERTKAKEKAAPRRKPTAKKPITGKAKAAASVTPAAAKPDLPSKPAASKSKAAPKTKTTGKAPAKPGGSKASTKPASKPASKKPSSRPASKTSTKTSAAKPAKKPARPAKSAKK